MESTMSQCPDKPTLQQYLLGRISEPLSDSVELHLAECKACDDTLAMLDDTNDSLIRHLPLAANAMQSPANHEEQPQWLQRLKGGPPAECDNATVTAELKPPLHGLESYELLDVLGRGGMGVVYRGRHKQLDRNVAIKIVSPRLVSAVDARQRFDREIAILGKLQHPGIVMATDAGRVREAAYLVMELIDGCDLARLVRRQGPLAVEEACEVARQIADALSAAHEGGAVHRDVKPSNVMLDRNGRAKLLDFGLARASDIQNHQRETSVGRLLGTLDYMAPEQASNGEVGSTADLFGLGATLFFLLTGRPPRSEDREQTVLQQLQSIATSDAPELQQLRADIPDELNSLVGRLLAREPEDRPASAAAVAEQLQAFADAAALRAVSNALPADEPKRDDAVVSQSLSALLGDDILVGMLPPVATSPASASEPNRGGRSIVRWLLGFGGIIAACFGVIFLLETPEGTLRIESESADVRVELLDEAEQVTKLQIKGGKGETVLRAGRYRIRLASEHDAFTVSQENIELTKNGIVEVRITKPVPRLHVSPTPNPNEPLYEGLTRDVWQARFQAESNPNAKVEAARALVELSETLSTNEQVTLLTSIGDELLTGAEGVNWYERSRVNLYMKFIPLTNWNGGIYKGIMQQWNSLLQLMSLELRFRPASELAQAFASVTKSGPDGSAAFAVMLLAERQFKEHLTGDEKATRTFIRSATAKQQTVDKALLLVRSEYADGTGQVDLIIDTFTSAGRQLLKAGDALTNDRFAGRWLEAANSLKPGKEVWGNAAFQYQLHNVYVGVNIEDDEVLLHWAKAAVKWLRENPAEDSERSGAIINRLRWHLVEAESQTGWPLAEIRSLIVPRVERRYLAETVPASWGEIGKTGHSTEDQLALLILAGGELPECTLTGTPPASAAKRFALLSERIALSGQQFETFKEYCVDRHLVGLINDAPVETIRLLAEHGSFTDDSNLMSYVSSLAHPRHKEELPPVDPLLLVAICSDLTGVSVEQDDRVCEILFCRSNTRPKPHQRGYSLLTQRTKPAQEVATEWLRKMREKTSHRILISEIDEWLPGKKQALRQAAEADPKSLEAVLRSYNKETQIWRHELFTPPIPALTPELLQMGIEASEKRYRELGKVEIADLLKEAAATRHLCNRHTFYVSDTLKTAEDSSIIFRHAVPTIMTTWPRKEGPPELVTVDSLSLTYRRDGYSSKTYGDSRPPIDGRWELIQIEESGKDISRPEFTTWLRNAPELKRLVIDGGTVLMPLAATVDVENKSGEIDHMTFDLILRNNGRHSTFVISKGGLAKLTGFFMYNESIDYTKLNILISRDGSQFPRKPTTIGTSNLLLKYQRVPARQSDAVDDPNNPDPS